jgi:eukaryotic-like serine/threonine-protein kinase
MARVFTITAASDTVSLDDKGRGEIAFTVANASGRQLRGRTRLSLSSQAPGENNWLTVAGEPERDFPVGGVQQFAVQVAVPPGSKEGKYTFRLDAYSVQNPDEDYSQGPTVAFTVAKQEVRKPFPWWIVGVAAAVIVVGAVVAWLFLRGGVTVPNITGNTVADANSTLTPLNLKIGNVTNVLTSAANVDKVLSQTPAAGQSVSAGSAIDVQVGVAIVSVPAVTGKLYNDAVSAIHAALLNVGQVSNVNSPGSAAGVVLSSSPAAGNSVQSGSMVNLSVQEETVPVPSVIHQNFNQAVATLTAANLRVGTVTGSIYQPVISGNVMRGVSVTAPVTSQNPSAGTAPVGSAVNLVFPNSTVAVNPAVVNQVAKAAHW